MGKLELQSCVIGSVGTNCYFLKNKGTGNKIKDVIHIYKRMIMKTLKMDKALKIIKYKKIYKNHQ